MKKFMALVLVAAMCMCLFAGCGSSNSGTAATEAPAEASGSNTFKIGGSGPLTGDAAIYGTAVKNGGQIAVDEINANGGINGYQVEWKFEDDQADSEIAVNAYNNLMDWGMQVMAGPTTTGSSISVSTKCNEERVFMMTPSDSSSDVTAGKDNVFQICFTDPSQGKLSAECISEKALGTKIAVIYNNADAYSTGIYQTFEAEAQALGLEIVSVTTFTDDTTDFSVQVADAKDKGAELVFLPIYYTPASMIFKQAAAVEYKPVFFGVDGMDGLLTMEGFDTSLAEGVMLLTPYSADSKDEQSAAFTAKYEEKFGDIPTQFSADTYDCVYVIYQALKDGAINADMSAEEICEAMIAYMPTITVEGVTGIMTWNAEGEVSKTPYAAVIKDGAYVGADNVESAQ